MGLREGGIGDNRKRRGRGQDGRKEGWVTAGKGGGGRKGEGGLELESWSNDLLLEKLLIYQV